MKWKKSACEITARPYSVEDARQLIDNRDIYIWGAGLKGRGFKNALERNGFTVTAFIDKSKMLQNSIYQGVTVISPEAFFARPDYSTNCFVFSATVDKKNKQIFEECKKHGLIKQKNFINIQEFCPFYPSIEISGICNLRCISCPRGNPEWKEKYLPCGFMSADVYRNVIQKLIEEIPFLYLVDLYIWGEPLLNPDLPEIISINHKFGVSSGISSNLNAGLHLEDVIKAKPAQIRVSVSGAEPETYEKTHTGGRWGILQENILKLSEYIKKYSPETLVEIYFHANLQNKESYTKIRDFCDQFGFRVMPSIHMIFPPYVLDYLKGKELPENAKEASKLMLVDLDNMIDLAVKEKNKSCLLKRCIPTINWNRAVLACCNMLPYVIAEDYLKTNLEEIIQSRNQSEMCRECQNYALHRYFNPLRYADIINKIYPPSR